MEVADCPPQQIAEASAIDAANVARGTLGVALDFSLESLLTFDDLLRRYLRHYRADARQLRGSFQFPFPAAMWGSYVGEVLRRRFGGEWVIAAPGANPELVLHGRRVSPIAAIARWYETGGEASVAEFVEEVESPPF
jgi:hypothetical protein